MLVLVGPGEGLEPADVVGVGDVEGVDVDADPLFDRRRVRGQGRLPLANRGLDDHRRILHADPTCAVVVVGIAVPEQVQASARADLDERQGFVLDIDHVTEREVQGRAPANRVRLGPSLPEHREQLLIVVQAEVPERGSVSRGSAGSSVTLP